MVRVDNFSLCLTESHRKGFVHRAASPPRSETDASEGPGSPAWPPGAAVVVVFAKWSTPAEHESPPNKSEGNYDAHCTVGVVMSLRIFYCKVYVALDT